MIVPGGSFAKSSSCCGVRPPRLGTSTGAMAAFLGRVVDVTTDAGFDNEDTLLMFEDISCGEEVTTAGSGG